MIKMPEDIFEIINKECSFVNSDAFTVAERDQYVLEPLRSCSDLAGIDWTYDEGISKLVLIFNKLGFVIKIPYTGRYSEDYEEPCDNCSKWSNCDCEYSCARRQNWTEYSNNEYCDFTGAEECPNTYLQKKLNNEWDYCEAEKWLYEKAKEEDVEVCFAETRLLGYVDGYPIYTQPIAAIYADCYTTTRKSHTAEEKISTQEACKKINGWCFNVEWLTDFIIYFGDDMFQKFMAFIKKYGISDLHNGNVGYVSGVPVLVDYSGYNDQCIRRHDRKLIFTKIFDII